MDLKIRQPRRSDQPSPYPLQFLPDSRNAKPMPAMEAGITDHVWSLEEVAALLDTNMKPMKARTIQEEVGMTNQEPCVKIRLVKPNGEIGFTGDSETSKEAEARYKRLVEACTKDRWFGARVQCLDAGGRIVHEHVISK